jgi:hypothetical protein
MQQTAKEHQKVKKKGKNQINLPAVLPPIIIINQTPQDKKIAQIQTPATA